MNRKLSLGAALIVAIAAACNVGNSPTQAPPTQPPATQAPPTSPPATPAPTVPPTGSPTGQPGGVRAVFTPTSGASPVVTGEATLTEVNGKTTVVLAIESSGTEALAASIQAGTCGSLNPEIAYRLTDVTSGASTTTISVTIEKLTATPYAINISVLGSETESSLACGQIEILPAS